MDISSICGSPGTKVTIKNKRGSNFFIQAGKSLVITDVVFDSLDSLLSPYDATSLACLKSRESCCKINSDGEITNDSITNPNLCKARLISSEECTLTSYRSFIKLKVSSIQKYTDPSVLTISNCEFRNFYYDINAIINPNQFASRITISSTIFSRISNCGSVLKNLNHYPTTVPSTIPDILTKKQDYFNYLTLKLVNEKASIYHSTGMSSTPFTMTCPASDCSSLTITGSTFEYLSDQKELASEVNVVPQTYQRYQAMALNFVNFPGDIVLKDNDFTKNYVMING